MTPAELRALTLIQARDAFAAGEVTSEALVSAAVDQARQYDAEYALFITPTFDEALAAAHEADRQRGEGKPLGPLQGVPITIKDNIDTAGVRTTGGAKVFANRVPAADATVVTRLTPPERSRWARPTCTKWRSAGRLPMSTTARRGTPGIRRASRVVPAEVPPRRSRCRLATPRSARTQAARCACRPLSAA